MDNYVLLCTRLRLTPAPHPPDPRTASEAAQTFPRSAGSPWPCCSRRTTTPSLRNHTSRVRAPWILSQCPGVVRAPAGYQHRSDSGYSSIALARTLFSFSPSLFPSLLLPVVTTAVAKTARPRLATRVPEGTQRTQTQSSARRPLRGTGGACLAFEAVGRGGGACVAFSRGRRVSARYLILGWGPSGTSSFRSFMVCSPKSTKFGQSAEMVSADWLSGGTYQKSPQNPYFVPTFVNG